MKTTLRKTLCLVLACLVCMLPLAAQAQPQVLDRMVRAYEGGSFIETVITLEMADDAGALITPEDLAGPVQELLRRTQVKIITRRGDMEVPEFGFELAIKDKVLIDGYVWFGEGEVFVVTSLLPGKIVRYETQEVYDSLELDMDELMGEQEALMAQQAAQVEHYTDLAGALGAYADIVTLWLETQGEEMAEVKDTPAAGQRDKAATQWTLRARSEELKVLLLTLAAEFANDVALQQMLMQSSAFENELTMEEESAELLATAAVLETRDSTMTWDVFYGEQGELVGVDAVIPTMFGEGEGEGTLTYDRLTRDGGKQAQHSVVGKVTEEDGGVASVRLEMNQDVTVPGAAENSFLIWLHQQEAKDAAQDDFKITHNNTITQAANREALESQTAVTLTNKPGAAQNDAAAQLAALFQTNVADFTAQVDFDSETRWQGDDDFVCESDIDLTFMGMKMGNIHVRVTNVTDYTFDKTGMETVQISKLEGTARKKFDAEFEKGMNLMAIRLINTVPPELVMLLMEME